MNDRAQAEATVTAHVLKARAELAAFSDGVERGAGTTPVELTVLLANLAAIGSGLPRTIANLSEHLGRTSVEDLSRDVPAETSRAFTIQVAQHYLDQAQAAAAESCANLQSALNAISSLDAGA